MIQAGVSKEKHIYTPDVAEAYLAFLASNPMDRRHFPDACYFLAHIYALSDDRVKVRTCYQKGLDAEDIPEYVYRVSNRPKTTLLERRRPGCCSMLGKVSCLDKNIYFTTIQFVYRHDQTSKTQ